MNIICGCNPRKTLPKHMSRSRGVTFAMVKESLNLPAFSHANHISYENNQHEYAFELGFGITGSRFGTNTRKYWVKGYGEDG